MMVPHSAFTSTIRLFWKRRRLIAKRRTMPFNGKDVCASFKPALRRPFEARVAAWAGPWLDIKEGNTGLALNRLIRYSYNAASLWLACPARGGFSRHHHNWFNSTLRGLTALVSLKLKFKGKSFRWHRRRKALVLRFGHSHLVTCQPPRDTLWKRGGKTKMLFFNSNLALLRDYLTAVVAWREPNRYHSRGLRLARQRIIRKAGKVSAYR